jgi:hypothetical protein
MTWGWVDIVSALNARKRSHTVGGIPCQDERCPKCGAKMLREGSYHHDLLEKKRAKNRNNEE